mgnify:CR=1 FL=1
MPQETYQQGMCREGENACVYKTNGGVLETIITTIDIHTKERKPNGCGYFINFSNSFCLTGKKYMKYKILFIV